MSGPVPLDFGLWTLDFGLGGSQSPTPARTKALAPRSALSIQPQSLDSSKISFLRFRDRPCVAVNHAQAKKGEIGLGELSAEQTSCGQVSQAILASRERHVQLVA